MTTGDLPNATALRRSADRERRRLLGLVSPAVVLVTILMVVPVGWLFYLSTLSDAGSFSLEHYRRLWEQPSYARTFRTTFEVSALTTAICVLLGYPLAYFLSELPKRAANLCMIAVLLPLWTSMLVRTYAWLVLLQRRGLINSWGQALGWWDEPLALVHNLTGTLIGTVHVMLPFLVMPLYAAMCAIDRDLLKAAANLGASPLHTFWRVFFPLSLPGLTTGALIVFILCLGFYITPAVLGGGKVIMVSTRIASDIELFFNWGAASALGVVLLVLTTAILFAASRLLRLDGALRGKVAAMIWWRQPATATQITHGARLWLYAVAVLVMVFLVVPTLLVIPMSFSGAQYLEFPPRQWSLRWYQSYFASTAWMQATATSLKAGVLTSLLATPLGTLAAYGLMVSRTRLAGMLTMLLLTPIVVPVILIGIGVFYVYVKLHLVNTLLGLVLAHSMLAVPVVMMVVSSALKTFDMNQELVARSLGASRPRAFVLVTLPQIRFTVATGAVLAFLTSFDEIVVSLFISGGDHSTLTRNMFNALRDQVDPTIAAISTIIVVITSLLLVVTQYISVKRR